MLTATGASTIINVVHKMYFADSEVGSYHCKRIWPCCLSSAWRRTLVVSSGAVRRLAGSTVGRSRTRASR